MIYPPLKQTSVGTPRNIVSLISLISQGFGERPEYYGGIGHTGLDWPCSEGTEILASHDGEAFYYEEKNPQGGFIGYGKYVSIRDRENGFKTEYCHLSKVVKTGQVKAGEVIGLSGNTGNSTAPHLHFTLKNPKAIDPIPNLVWFDSMKLKRIQILALQILDGYSDSAGVDFWEGKELDDYLKIRLQDRIKQEKEVLDKYGNS